MTMFRILTRIDSFQLELTALIRLVGLMTWLELRFQLNWSVTIAIGLLIPLRNSFTMAESSNNSRGPVGFLVLFK